MRRIKKSTKQTILVCVGIVAILLGVFWVVYNIQLQQVKATYRLKLEEQERFLFSKKRSVYVVQEKVKSGSVIKKKNLSKMMICSDIAQNQYFSEKDIGKRALVTIEPTMPILRAMVTDSDVENSTREHEFTEIKLNTNLQKNDLIDVRIAFPNGESYVVLSKKELTQLALDNNGCYMNLNAEEQDRIQSAFVDAYVNKANLYSVKYLEAAIQEPSVVNYTPSTQVINLIEKDPNIVHTASKYLTESTRLDLEVRLNVFRKSLANRQLEEKRQEKLILDLEEETTEDSDETLISDKNENLKLTGEESVEGENYNE